MQLPEARHVEDPGVDDDPLRVYVSLLSAPDATTQTYETLFRVVLQCQARCQRTGAYKDAYTQQLTKATSSRVNFLSSFAAAISDRRALCMRCGRCGAAKDAVEGGLDGGAVEI